MNRNIVKATLAVAAAGLIPLALAPAAQASTTTGGCTLTPLRPVYDHHNSAGNKVIRYDMTVTCSSGREIEIEQHVHEEDAWPNADDHITTSNRTRNFSSTDTVTMWLESTLPNTEIDREEMFQHVRFRVTSNGVTSAWTAFEDSPVQQFSN